MLCMSACHCDLEAVIIPEEYGVLALSISVPCVVDLIHCKRTLSGVTIYFTQNKLIPVNSSKKSSSRVTLSRIISYWDDFPWDTYPSDVYPWVNLPWDDLP